MNHDKFFLQIWPLDDDRQHIRAIIVESGLAPLIDYTYCFANSTILSTFYERWQPETNTFHLPFEKMTITLDDMATIIHIPIIEATISF